MDIPEGKYNIQQFPGASYITGINTKTKLEASEIENRTNNIFSRISNWFRSFVKAEVSVQGKNYLVSRWDKRDLDKEIELETRAFSKIQDKAENEVNKWLKDNLSGEDLEKHKEDLLDAIKDRDEILLDPSIDEQSKREAIETFNSEITFIKNEIGKKNEEKANEFSKQFRVSASIQNSPNRNFINNNVNSFLSNIAEKRSGQVSFQMQSGKLMFAVKESKTNLILDDFKELSIALGKIKNDNKAKQLKILVDKHKSQLDSINNNKGNVPYNEIRKAVADVRAANEAYQKG